MRNTYNFPNIWVCVIVSWICSLSIPWGRAMPYCAVSCPDVLTNPAVPCRAVPIKSNEWHSLFAQRPAEEFSADEWSYAKWGLDFLAQVSPKCLLHGWLYIFSTVDRENRWLLTKLLTVDWDSPHQEQASVDRENHQLDQEQPYFCWMKDILTVNQGPLYWLITAKMLKHRAM